MDEREKILQMLVQGVVTIPEALILLDAIKEQSNKEDNKDKEPFVGENYDKLREKLRLLDEKLEHLGQDISEFVKETINKVDEKIKQKKEKKQ
ncbi:MAG: hypothetical protein PHP65_03140 [Bacilli bacterium]|nr:hypothetical protein [Bacilli bacterium]